MGRDDWDEDVPTVESNLGVFFHEKEGKPAELEQIEGPGAPRTIPLQMVHMIVGRAPNAAIRIDSIEVSRQHMALRRVGDEYRCEDLESRNGIYLNGIKIHSVLLREGDTIQLGNVVFVFHEGN
jgi:pSer/pThr/pTyr-binding forkhead associated (FHA) protein